MKREQITDAVNSHPIISHIHDELFDSSLSLAEAYNKACVAIYELSAEVKELRNKISAGYVRTDTTHFKWRPKNTPQPVDGGDEWIQTGVSHDG